MASKGGGGQTIVVAGGSGGGGSKDGGSNGGSSPKTKDPLSGGKLNVDDQMFWAVMIGAGALAVAAHVYTSNPVYFMIFLHRFRSWDNQQLQLNRRNQVPK